MVKLTLKDELHHRIVCLKEFAGYNSKWHAQFIDSCPGPGRLHHLPPLYAQHFVKAMIRGLEDL